MQGGCIKEIKEIRFVATNYYNLQGLRTVPLSILLVLVCLWANGLQYPISIQSWLILALEVVISIVLFYAIDRYYMRAFGRVKRTPESRRLEWLVSSVGGILALAAFWLDNSFKLPLSLIGLIFGAGMLADYIRITWLVKGRYLLYYPIGAVLMVVVSLLPLLGLPDWWHTLGIKAQIFAIPMIIGIYSIIAGIWGHLFLVRTLSHKVEEK